MATYDIKRCPSCNQPYEKNFYSGKKTDGIYSFFRSSNKLAGVVEKPTGKSEESIELETSYSIKWEGLTADIRYYIIDINEGA